MYLVRVSLENGEGKQWRANRKGVHAILRYASFFRYDLSTSSTIKLKIEVLMFRVALAATALTVALSLSSGPVRAQLPRPNGGTIERGVLPAHWLSQEPKCMEIPEWQVHEYNPNLYILRQSPCTDYEKPFLYLLFGKEKSLLMDTGSRNGNLAPALQRTVTNWLARNGRASIPLIVVHSRTRRPHLGRQGTAGHEQPSDAGDVHPLGG